MCLMLQQRNFMNWANGIIYVYMVIPAINCCSHEIRLCAFHSIHFPFPDKKIFPDSQKSPHYNMHYAVSSVFRPKNPAYPQQQMTPPALSPLAHQLNHHQHEQHCGGLPRLEVNPSAANKGLLDPRLYNDQLRPLAPGEQQWTAYNFFALWMSVVHNVAGYIVAGTLFSLGLASGQVLICLLIGILLLELLCDLVSEPSQSTGIPFPVITRCVLGIRGAYIPSVICVILATAWYGVQTYVASRALVVVLLKFIPGVEPWNDVERYGFLGLSALGYIAYSILWVVQMLLFFLGMNAIRRFTDWAGPAVYVVIVGIAVYLVAKAGIGNISLSLSTREPLGFWESIPVMLSAIGIVVSGYSVAAVNFGIFARYGKSYRTVRIGNFLGLPVNYMFFSILTVLITSATKPVFGELITDPIEVMARIGTVEAVLIGGITFVVATIGINVAANFTLPAFNLSNLEPRRISWQTGGMFTSICSFLIAPWTWWSNPVLIHYTLGTLGALMSPLMGVLLAGYFIILRRRVSIAGMYSLRRDGPYWFWHGFNPNALIALFLSGLCAIAALILPPLLSPADPSIQWISNCSFLIGVIFAVICFVGLEKILPRLKISPAEADVIYMRDK